MQTLSIKLSLRVSFFCVFFVFKSNILHCSSCVLIFFILGMMLRLCSTDGIWKPVMENCSLDIAGLQEDVS